MKALELSALLIVPLILVALSVAGIISTRDLELFHEELEGAALAQAPLESRLAELEAKIKTEEEVLTKEIAGEVMLVSRDTVASVRGLLGDLGGFSHEIGSWAKRQSYFMLVLGLLNVALVLSVYRSSKRVQ